jgi:[FeFe] hydrogenase H-cluster maturation GTPase HydF
MFITPSGNRLHIGIFGRRNLGKSSLINAITSQAMAIVSSIPGTTTDPVYKSMEILPIGPCMLIDTAGIDDSGELGMMRIEATRKVLRKTDLAILLFGRETGFGGFEKDMIQILNEKKIPYIPCINKCDKGGTEALEEELTAAGLSCIKASSLTGEGIPELKDRIIEVSPSGWAPVPLVKDILNKGDIVIMVCPIDGAMPQGRLILPQVQVLREILDSDSLGLVLKPDEIGAALASLKKEPRLVVTDSQAFEDVSALVPEDIPLTSFSIVFARHKGDLGVFVSGIEALKGLRDGDEILIAEACTHHVQPEDIGRSKIPTWLRKYTGKDLVFDVVSGGDFPDDPGKYKLVISCGGCMVTRREVQHRMNRCLSSGVPITNYGVIIAFMSGILERVIAPFREKQA